MMDVEEEGRCETTKTTKKAKKDGCVVEEDQVRPDVTCYLRPTNVLFVQRW